MSNILIAQGWGQTQKIVPDDRFLGQQFGADIAIDGNYAVVGVLVNNLADAAYIYEYGGNGNWVQLQKLESPEPNQFDHFGVEVAIDGDYIFIGAIGEDYDALGANFVQGAGAVYIFKKQANGTFLFEHKIVASDREFINEFGRDIAISGDYAIVGVQRQDYDAEGNNFIDDAGAAYIFEKDDDGIWKEVNKLVASDRGAFDYFGEAVAIDGNYAVVGAYIEDEDENGANTLDFSGSAYIFERDGIGDWNQVQKIVPSNRQGSELFGRDVAVSGNFIAVGAEQGNVIGDYTGSVYMFERNGTGIWNEVQEIVVSNASNADKIGYAVDIDGNVVIAGAYNTSIGGSAYVFEKDINGDWNQVQHLIASDIATLDSFGYDVALNGDYAIVGAYEEDEDEMDLNTLTSAGSAYFFDANEPTLSVSETTLENDIKVYPNPTNGELTIDLNQQNKQIQIEVYNILGQRIIDNTYHATQTVRLRLDAPPGSYYVRMITDVTSVVVKIIKQ
nr:T9SS type A sorting domain-containing protein [uncultured Psychroserpens sp.]